MFENYTDTLFNDKIILNYNKYLEVIIAMYTQKKLIKLHEVVMMIRDCKHLIRLQLIPWNKCMCVNTCVKVE